MRHEHDQSNGYEAIASEFEAQRHSHIGVVTVRTWTHLLPPRASVLDLGCGHGMPISMALIEDDFTVYGVDASPRLTTAFRDRFPQAHVACEAVEDSRFFDRTFDAVIAVGLMFLLSPEAQLRLIAKVADTLKPGGRFLFTSPAQMCTWNDELTGRQSQSLGADAYKDALLNVGLALVAEHVDEGGNYYYDSCLTRARS